MCFTKNALPVLLVLSLSFPLLRHPLISIFVHNPWILYFISLFANIMFGLNTIVQVNGSNTNVALVETRDGVDVYTVPWLRHPDFYREK